MKILDPGHEYQLITLDGDDLQTLRFVKRVGEKYPGNKDAHSGTNIQDVLRVCIDRLQYVNKQMYAVENLSAQRSLRTAIEDLEFRAFRMHGVRYHHTRSGEKVEQKPVCECCGHLVEIHHAAPV